MENADIDRLARQIANLRERVADFSTEFAPLADERLRDMIDQQEIISRDATYKAEAAESELLLRRLTSIIAGGT